MKRKTRGKKCVMALKIDISKAYDCIDWIFLDWPSWVDLMMLCVTTVRYSVVVNGNLVGPIVPKSGLRHDDPLSPY